jgi:hypothetical protein
VIVPSESGIYGFGFFWSASTFAPKQEEVENPQQTVCLYMWVDWPLLLKHFDALNLTWLVFKLSNWMSVCQIFVRFNLYVVDDVFGEDLIFYDNY